MINATLVISLVRMLVGGAGAGRAANQKALLATGLSRCLAEMALASNAPAVLKSQSLNALADIVKLSIPNQLAFASLVVSPLIPPLAPPQHEPDYPAVGNQERQAEEDAHSGEPQSDDSKWQRGEPETAVFSAIAIAVHGDGTPGREGLRVRAAAAGLFQVRHDPLSHLRDRH